MSLQRLVTFIFQYRDRDSTQASELHRIVRQQLSRQNGSAFKHTALNHKLGKKLSSILGQKHMQKQKNWVPFGEGGMRRRQYSPPWICQWWWHVAMQGRIQDFPYGDVDLRRGRFSVKIMVPTRTGNQGKSGKMGRHFPVREKSGNFVKTGKVREFYSQY